MPTFRVALVGATLAALAIPLAPTVAHATIVTPTLVYAADVNRDGSAGLYKATAADPTTKTAILTDDGSVSVAKALLSPDGSRIAVLADFNAGSASDNFTDSLVTMNLDGSNRHTLVNEVFTNSATGYTFDALDGFAWKGNTDLVYGWFEDSSQLTVPTEKLRDVSATGGTPTDIAGTANMGQPAVSPDGSQIAAVLYGNTPVQLYVFPSSSAATKHLLASEPNTNLTSPAWSPDGANIAFVRDESDDTFDASQIDTVHFDSGTSTWGAATTAVQVVKGADAAWFDADPQWTDNATLMFDRVDDSSSAAPANGVAPIDLWTATNTGTWGAPANVTSTPSVDEWSPSEAPQDTTAPSAVTFQPFILSGTSITVRWTTPDADYSHVTLHRTDDTAATPAVDLTNKFGTSFVDTGLTVGHTYTYTADTFDGAGNQAASATPGHDVTATYPAKIVAVTPTAIGTAYLPFRVTWGVANQPANTTYDVDYTVKSGTNWALGATYHFLTGTATTSGAFTNGVPGQTYYFRATVHDTHGNATSTSWSGVNVPFDQKSGTFSRGWTTISNRVYWLGSLAATSTNGSTFTITPTSKSVSIIGTKCAACGKFAVYVDGHYRGTVSSAATSTKYRQVLWTGINTAIGKHTIKLVAVLAAHQTLQIDGVADPR